MLIDNCVDYAGEKNLVAICLTPTGHDLVPLFESLGFVRDDNDLAELMRQAGSAGPMRRPIPKGAAEPASAVMRPSARAT